MLIIQKRLNRWKKNWRRKKSKLKKNLNKKNKKLCNKLKWMRKIKIN